jgi:hypothetical protein
MRLLKWFMLLIAAFTAQAGISVDIDLQEQKAYLLQDGYVVYQSPISSGRYGHLTPPGEFKITQKNKDHYSSLYGRIVDSAGRTINGDADSDMPVPPGGKFVPAPMKYFIRFNGAVGMHAGLFPGYPASHGCVRLPRAKAELFFNILQIGDTVRVYGKTPVRRPQPKVEAQPEPVQVTPPRRRGIVFPWQRQRVH